MIISENLTNCTRCEGFVVWDSAFPKEGRVDVARCISCGNVHDPLIIENKLNPPILSHDESKKRSCLPEPRRVSCT